MENLRKYGKPPFNVVVIHGGPGMPGEVEPVARELSSQHGILEPLQTAVSLEGQVLELYDVLKDNSNLPVTIIGWSWGAMLGFILAARYPSIVKKLILVSSGAFSKRYARKINKTRLRRLSREERAKFKSVIKVLDDPCYANKDMLMLNLETLLYKTDMYNPLPFKSDVIEYQYNVFRDVWRDAEKFRAGGELLKKGRDICCPVVAIHGKHDPHPYQGVVKPLSGTVRDFKFIMLEKCGHKPWIEKEAKDKFYNIIKKELEH
jgi:pimeloyl-ACP methyl ester carboxylesterase